MNHFFSKYQIEEDKIAVGVSGGADSLAMAILLKEWADNHQKKIIALTIDHKLRKESGAEAEYVAQVMERFGIEHHILTWEGEKPSTGIEEAARNARYNLIRDWCEKNGVLVLAMGHHMHDQAETFLLRLIRGSGLYGLSSILPISHRDGLKIIRPNLFMTPNELKKVLICHHVNWVEDPSNQNQDFLRVKIRNYLPNLDKEIGLSAKRLSQTAEILSRTRSFLEFETSKFIKNNVKSYEQAGASFSCKLFLQQHSEMQYLILASLIKEIGKNIYTPEAEEILRLTQAIEQDGFVGATLGKCEIFIFDNKLWITPELKIKQKPSKKAWEDFVENNPKLKKIKLPYKMRLSLMSSKPI